MAKSSIRPEATTPSRSFPVNQHDHDWNDGTHTEKQDYTR